MIEVEAKIKIENPKKIRALAKKVGKFKGIQTKTDDYYTLQKNSKYPKKSLRIRNLDGTYQINFKEKLSYVKGIHAKNETEFVVKEIAPFMRLIKNFGFKHWLRKIKLSEIYEIERNFHIEINNVKNLGWFIEIEYLAHKGEIEKARKKILTVIRKLDLSSEEIIKTGYTKMLWDKR